ncbi:hypothetical protein EOM09_08705 [bacterium]|nr:hypothetical protein [bacterium]
MYFYVFFKNNTNGMFSRILNKIEKVGFKVNSIENRSAFSDKDYVEIFIHVAEDIGIAKKVENKIKKIIDVIECQFVIKKVY